eukprot:TRINITY_DN12177_c0_g2_i1.p1 TRINITY_DN12177_c0_g2~~TRINITY_DN12177_c0_g2_i1.p1  ORF type:complete len:608 (+),score=105.24 TRINITY_DN12177_c0_g2_i1:190-2013(+)
MASEEDKLKKLFKTYDKDGNGSLSKEEMAVIFRKTSGEWADDDLDYMFAKVDKDGNGVIDYNEFVAWLMEEDSDYEGEAQSKADAKKSDASRRRSSLLGDEMVRVRTDILDGDGVRAAMQGVRAHRRNESEKAAKHSGLPASVRAKFACADPSRWKFDPVEYGGSYSFSEGTKPVFEDVTGPISGGLQTLKDDPVLYEAIIYQSNMVDWPEDQQKFQLVKRTNSGFMVKGQGSGPFTCVQAKYERLPPNPDGVPAETTESEAVLLTFRGQSLGTWMPGRGQGVADVPSMKLLDEVTPGDINQGGVGNCWLLSAIAALADFKGAMRHIFKNTPDLEARPLADFNKYTVTLYDLPTWEPRDVVVDERLCCRPTEQKLLGASPGPTGETWVCYLEKAVALHCGGWDKIEGGQCTQAWRLLTGCREQYTFKKADGGGFGCFGLKNPNTGEWEKAGNAPGEGFNGMWPMPWPEVGGGGELESTLPANELFERMCAWEDANYMMCASTEGSGAGEVVAGHAYSILNCVSNVAGTDTDLIKMRNPWGREIFKSGKWADEGPGWAENPDIAKACNHVVANDGVFWVEKDEFFELFPTVYLCANDMSTFVEAVEEA